VENYITFKSQVAVKKKKKKKGKKNISGIPDKIKNKKIKWQTNIHKRAMRMN
jgi:hypothetical protein